MNRTIVVWGIVAFAALILVLNTFYIVDQRTQVVVLRLGEFQTAVNPQGVNDPGLKVRVPFLDRVIALDKRNLDLEAEKEEIIALGQARLVVDAFLRYRISDPETYYRTLRNETTAQDRLERLVNSSLRQVLGSASQEDIVSGRRGALTALARDDVAKRAKASKLGIEVVDLKIKRADLPQQNQDAVFRRMRTSRQQEAAQIRSQGEQQKRTIIGEADKEVTITLATATQQADITRGQGDAQRTRIFAQSFGKDPSFAAFWRSMQAYEASLGQGDTTLVLSPNSDFFKYFERGPNAK